MAASGGNNHTVKRSPCEIYLLKNEYEIDEDCVVIGSDNKWESLIVPELERWKSNSPQGLVPHTLSHHLVRRSQPWSRDTNEEWMHRMMEGNQRTFIVAHKKISDLLNDDHVTFEPFKAAFAKRNGRDFKTWEEVNMLIEAGTYQWDIDNSYFKPRIASSSSSSTSPLSAATSNS